VEWIDALAGETVGLDSAPLIYFIEQDPQRAAKLRPFFAAAEGGQFRIVTPKSSGFTLIWRRSAVRRLPSVRGTSNSLPVRLSDDGECFLVHCGFSSRRTNPRRSAIKAFCVHRAVPALWRYSKAAASQESSGVSEIWQNTTHFRLIRANKPTSAIHSARWTA